MEPWGTEAFEMGVDAYVFVFVRTEDDRTDRGWEYVTEAGKGEGPGGRGGEVCEEWRKAQKGGFQ